MLSELPQDRHPERSASRIYRLTEGLQRVVEGPRGCLLADALHSFPATKTMREIKKSQPPREADLSRPAPARRGACRGGICSSLHRRPRPRVAHRAEKPTASASSS